MTHSKLSRRKFMHFAGLTGGTALLAACAAPTAVIPPTEAATATPAFARDRPIDLLVDKYVAAWSEPEPAPRQALLEQVMHENVNYDDYDYSSPSRAAMDARIAAAHQVLPGFRMTVTGQTYYFGNHVIFSWLSTAADGSVLPGIMYASLADAKLTKIVNFYGNSV